MSNRNTRIRHIDSRLFEKLEIISELVPGVIGVNREKLSQKEKDRYDKDVVRIKEALRIFLSNFIMQFFKSGYNIDARFLTADMIDKINAIPEEVDGSPKRMKKCLNDYVNNISDELDVYGGDNRFITKTAYCSSVYRLLKSFKNEGVKVIENYEQIAVLAQKFISKIEINCRGKEA